MVVNTAAATEQQLMLSLFDKVIEEDNAGDVELTYEVKVDENASLKISSNSYDCFRVFQDFCSLIEHQKPSFLQFNSISEPLGFELLETVLSNYKDLFLNHVEFAFLVRTRVTPLLLRSFSNHRDFPIVVRVSRIILLLVRSQLSILEIEAEVMLSLLTHVLTKDSNLPNWKKVLSLEVFNGIFQDFKLVKLIFQKYDYDFDNGTKKKIIGELLNVCSSLINEPPFEKLLNSSESVKPPDPNERSITLQNSSLKVPYLELLDKLEPPPVPETYQIYLILNCINSFGEGLGKYVLNKSKADERNTFTFLSDLTEDQQQDLDILVLKSIIVTTVQYVVNIGNQFLYSCLSNELFHSSIRSLQKLCHSSGILGLDRERDSLLLLFSFATVSNSSRRSPNQSRNNSFGDFIVEQLTSTGEQQHQQQPQESKFHARNLNSRHVICFRALTSLTISLGPILSKSWKFILITFQWFDYYVNGPSKYLSFKGIPPKPDLSQSDLKSIESSLLKLNENTRNLDDFAFDDLSNELIKLSTTTIFEPTHADEPLYNNELSICPYNREFFTDKLIEFSCFNAERLIQPNSEYQFWELINTFLIDVLISKKSIYKEDDIKLSTSASFNSLIKETSRVGFKQNKSPEVLSNLEIKLFKSLSLLIGKLLETGDAVSSIELEIVHTVLDTLFDLLDRFGEFFQNSWNDILDITNTPFIFLKSKSLNDNKNMISSSKNLLKSSFEILQLILNDFLQSIKPLKTTKLIIDVLNNFVSQQIDLNISFSAVSYYWLLSDFFRQISLQSSDVKGNEDLDVDTVDELVELIVSDQTVGNVNALWLYLLNSLVRISNDERIEIKNVAIQTFFRIVDSHGSYLNWRKTFGVVVKDLLLIDLKVPQEDDYELRKSFIDNVLIILKGVNDLYSLFFISYHDEILWTSLLNFYERLIVFNIVEISTNVYISFNQILKLFENNVPIELFENFFSFWSSQKVKYVSVNESDSYQDCLVELINGFKLLNSCSELTRSQVESSLLIFNNSIRFPFLPKFSSDVLKPTKLQDTILESFKLINLTESIEDLILVQLSNLVLLPFQTRSRILKKLQSSSKKQIPSFIAASSKSISILEHFLNTIDSFEPLIDNKVLVKIIKNLFDSINFKSDSSDDLDHFNEVSTSEIWKRCQSLVLSIIPNFTHLLDSNNSSNSTELWSLIINVFTTSLPDNNNNRDSDFNLESYQTLKGLILENLSQDSLTHSHIETLVSSIWKSSFLYENNLLEDYLFETNSTPGQLTKQILALDIDSYSTEPIKLYPQQSFRFVCLSDLFELSNINNDTLKKYSSDLNKLTELALPYLLSRIVLIIRRFSDQQKLVNNLPVYTIQKKELTVLLQKLYELLKQLKPEDSETYEQLFSIFPFILDNQQYLEKLKNSQSFLTGITVEFYKLTNGGAAV
jgi:hypothetical protein